MLTVPTPMDPSRPDSKRERIVHGAILLLPAAALLLLRDQIAWIASYPAAWTLPIARVIDRAMGWLIESCDLGLFTFRELTRAIAWLLTWPLKWMESLLVTGFADGVVGPLPWISVVALAVLVGLAPTYVRSRLGEGHTTTSLRGSNRVSTS